MAKEVRPVHHSHPHGEEKFDLSRTMRGQDDLNRVWAGYAGGHLPTTATIEVSAIAVADSAPPSTPRKRRKGARS